MESKLFTDMKYILGNCNNPNQLKEALQENGATLKHYLSEIVTHVISDSTCLVTDEAAELYDATVVTPSWVYLSLKFKKLLPPCAFSPFRNYFSNIVVAFSPLLHENDIKKLSSMTTFHGGKVTINQTNATHIIVTKDEEENIDQSNNSKLVTPDWIIDSVKQKKQCDEHFYHPNLLEYPPPKIDTPPPPSPNSNQVTSTPPAPDLKSQFDTATYPFANCYFKFTEYEDVDAKTKENWFAGIKLAGGIFKDDVLDVTHLICETRSTTTYDRAIKFGVRCITIHWINDVIAERNMKVPWKALHLPLAFEKGFKALSSHIITATNFKGKEKTDVKQMILKTGATYTGYMSHHNTLLVCRNIGGLKYEKAIQWKVPIVNCQFLNDILLNHSADVSSMLTQSKYQLFHSDPLKLMSHSSELFDAWNKPIKHPYRKQVPLVNVSANQNGNHDRKAYLNALLVSNSELIFKDKVFFITPGVKPNVSVISKMIETAGGLVATKKLPSKLQIEQLESKGQEFIIVSCHNDKHLLANLDAAVVTVDFVMSGIMHQELPSIDKFMIN